MIDPDDDRLIGIHDCLNRIEGHAGRQARYARFTMQAVFVVWVLLVVLIIVTVMGSDTGQ